MSWYATSWQHMHAQHQQALAGGSNPDEIAKAIDDSYPFSQRSGWAYKAWLDARRDFFRQHNLPLRRAKKPAPDLLCKDGEAPDD
ncbi:hypothetical protein LF844_09645 [Metapseudomonas lalkuanensis]|uniref:hypothetical protein n=1 Tax=Metapseudomonas lalkuanensis TaxID=2604832 RepID=UPI001CF58CA5|nr:hypothetical protein [Pseudomonas lalkuanensis]UCP00052.1 hypothetical protein LF844_09645 [Pseudomonas lalkuanensis]